jgi:hypothetical protein
LGKTNPAQVGHGPFYPLKIILNQRLRNSPSTGVFSVAAVSSRALPSFDDTTQETVHPSVLEQDKLRFTLKDYLSEHPELTYRLTPLEEEWKRGWPYSPDAPQVQQYKLWLAKQAEAKSDNDPASGEKTVKRSSLFTKLLKASGLRKDITVTSVIQKTHRYSKSQT